MLLLSLLACAAQATPLPHVFLDPGHGAPGNPGNTNSRCESEQDVMLGLAERVRERLEERGAKVRLAREAGQLVSYDDRLQAARDWGADVYVSLHSDVRATSDERCPDLDGGEGFSVLWGSDADDATLPGAREDLARRIGLRMSAAGFQPYRGDSYGALYLEDARVPGVFLDNHAPAKRIKVLRRATMPSVIVETHHAWVDEEVALWGSPVVANAFADALLDAVRDHLARP